ncbi:MAG: hypothetical protein RL333_745 [Pseudomonadota bacterium]
MTISGRMCSRVIQGTASALLTTLLGGCNGLGPNYLSEDRINYSEAISDSWKEEMLLNLVKLRFGDAPVFLEVASVISQYQVQGVVSLNGSWFNTPSPVYPAQMLGGVGSYADRPTVTFSPVMGQRFARSLMNPIPPAAVISLIQAGYPADQVLRLLVHSINGLVNRYGGQERARTGDPLFYRLIDLMRKAQLSNAIGLRTIKINDKQSTLFIIRSDMAQEVSIISEEIRGLLKLAPSTSALNITYGSVSGSDHEIAILTRSVMDVLIELSSYLDVSPNDVAENRVNQTPAIEQFKGTDLRPLIRIHCSSWKPHEAFIKIKYRNQWFWIDDRDIASKRMLSFIMLIFSLVETDEKAASPVLTIPTG